MLETENVNLSSQARLRLLALRIPNLSNLLLGSIDRDVHLVERILFALVKLLPAQVDPLLAAQTGVLLFDLR